MSGTKWVKARELVPGDMSVSFRFSRNRSDTLAKLPWHVFFICVRAEEGWTTATILDLAGKVKDDTMDNDDELEVLV